MKWKWVNSRAGFRVPGLEFIKQEAREMLEEVASGPAVQIESGGFRARRSGLELHLTFEVSASMAFKNSKRGRSAEASR